MTQEPKIWSDMTPEEKGALLLAEHEGKVIQYFSCVWDDGPPQWFDNVAYRIKPEPKRETVVLVGSIDTYGSWSFTVGEPWPSDSHKITFNLIDGKPDPANIKMEKL